MRPRLYIFSNILLSQVIVA